MRLKYYLRGASLGIIVTTLILSIAFAFSGNTKEISDEEVLKRAAELGWVEGESQTLSEDESVAEDDKDSSSDADTKEDSSDTKDETEDSSKATSSGKSSESTNTKNSSTASSSETSETVSYVPFTVSGGESSNTVALHLQQAGLVEDADDFNTYMNKLNVDNLIQAGTFYVASDATYDDLVAALVTKQDKRLTSLPELPETPDTPGTPSSDSN